MGSRETHIFFSLSEQAVSASVAGKNSAAAGRTQLIMIPSQAKCEGCFAALATYCLVTASTIPRSCETRLNTFGSEVDNRVDHITRSDEARHVRGAGDGQVDGDADPGRLMVLLPPLSGGLA
jgi:hypothetical protein